MSHVQTKPLVSIAMASYNGERYIAEQIGSIIEQTYRPIEIVIVDDHSQDGTVAIVRSFQEKYPFILLLQNEQNLGVTKTFEKAVRDCRGEYIALCDQDDIWMPHKLETLVNGIGDHDAVYANSLLVDQNGQSLGKEFSSMMKMRSYYCGTPFLLCNSVPGHAILMRSDFVKNLLPFPQEIFFDLWIAYSAAGNKGIRYVDEVLVHYRQHDANTVGTRDSKKKKKRPSAEQQFREKLRELQILSTAPVSNTETKNIMQEMLSHFHRRWSFKRSLFFFRNYDQILISKNKPEYRKKMYCLKMFFKPNF